MIGDEDLNIYQEKNSTQSLVNEIWNVVEDLAYRSYLIPQYKYAMLDDHLPFINAGYPTALLIDFDYPYCIPPQIRLSMFLQKVCRSSVMCWCNGFLNRNKFI
jgi:hypothetical protein